MGEGPTAALLQQIFEVDPLACPTCHGAMRIVAIITQTSVIDQILTHLRTRAAHATHAGAPRTDASVCLHSSMNAYATRHHPRMILTRTRTITAFIALCCAASATSAQQLEQRRDTASVRSDYRDLNELLEHLPQSVPPAFDLSQALWLAALPMACLDRLQPRPGGRANRALAASDTATQRDSAGRARAASTAPPTTNNGAGYFWVPTYTVVSDHGRTRAFWGCNDWHSAVASTWATAYQLRRFPKSALHVLAREKLNAHLGTANLNGELAFFQATAAAINPIPSASQTGLFERPYGFAWLLTLYAELRTWPDSQATRWANNTAPLARWMADSLGAYFNKLVEPVRTGAQANTAQNLLLALEYSDAVGDAKLRPIVMRTARRFFARDTACATQSERIVPLSLPGGGRGNGSGANAANAVSASGDSAARSALKPNDLTAAGRGASATPPAGGGAAAVLSPCLAEAALMSRVLPLNNYATWLGRFLPPLQSSRFAPLTDTISIPPVTSRNDSTVDAAAIALTANERARIAGLSFARAQALVRIANALPRRDSRVPVFRRLANMHAERGFLLLRDDTAGLSWVPAQALMYEAVRNK